MITLSDDDFEAGIALASKYHIEVKDCDYRSYGTMFKQAANKGELSDVIKRLKGYKPARFYNLVKRCFFNSNGDLKVFDESLIPMIASKIKKKTNTLKLTHSCYNIHLVLHEFGYFKELSLYKEVFCDCCGVPIMRKKHSYHSYFCSKECKQVYRTHMRLSVVGSGNHSKRYARFKRKDKLPLLSMVEYIASQKRAKNRTTK